MGRFEVAGISLNYREQGSGELLIVLPGNTASSVCHEGELEYFSNRYRVVSLDFRGTGQSDRLKSWSYDWWEKCTDDVAALIQHLGYENAIIMGTSGGGNIALLCAVRHSGLVRAVVADSCAEKYNAENLRQEVKGREAKTEEQIGFWAYANGDDWEDVVASDSRLLLETAERGGDLFTGRLKDITCSVLLTGSSKDSFVPDIENQLSAMHEQIENSHMYIHQEGDHPLMWICPEVFRKQSDEFLAKL